MSIVSEFNDRIAAYENLKKSIVDDVKKDFETFVEGVLKENDCPYLIMRGFIRGLSR